MAIQKVFCPSCGHETQINTDKPFSFCTECGNKIVLPKAETPIVTPTVIPSIQNEMPTNNKYDDTEITSKLEEVAFYYKLSYEKKEYENTEENPTYYLKAQDILVDLSDLYPEDYRIWWELCKPIDYMCSSSGADVHNQYRINEDYFSKALDKADLSKKRILIEDHDKYVQNKENAMQLAQKKLAEIEQARKEKELAEKKAYEEKCEQDRKRKEQEAEQQRLQAEAEQKRIEEEKAKAERQRLEKENALIAERENNLANSKSLWLSLSSKDYSKINNTYFEIVQDNNQKIIAIFKLISNMLYLNAYRIDGNKGNAIYQEQSFAMQFNADGFAIKFDDKPITIKGLISPDNTLRIVECSNGQLYINNAELKSNTEYIASIMKSAKKPLLALSKVFS